MSGVRAGGGEDVREVVAIVFPGEACEIAGVGVKARKIRRYGDHALARAELAQGRGQPLAQVVEGKRVRWRATFKEHFGASVSGFRPRVDAYGAFMRCMDGSLFAVVVMICSRAGRDRRRRCATSCRCDGRRRWRV